MVQEKLNLGEVLITRGIAEAIKDFKFHDFCYISLLRHANCDWGDLCEEDKITNDEAVKSGEDRIFSAYNYSETKKIWIITEWDRKHTTILFPEEY